MVVAPGIPDPEIPRVFDRYCHGGTLFVRLAADHLLRRPELAVDGAGLVINELTRSGSAWSPVCAPTAADLAPGHSPRPARRPVDPGHS